MKLVLLLAIVALLLGAGLAWFGVRGALTCIGIGLTLWLVADHDKTLTA